MKYYSTNRKAPLATLEEAVKRGLAPDRGLYMPERIVRLPEEFFRDMGEMDFHEIAFAAASAFFGEDIPSGDLKDIVCDTLNFDTPVVNIHDNIWALELYHGPTLAFKDVGGRFMARMLSYFVRQEKTDRKTTVIVATSGDTGSAVANGFLGVEGIDVIVLYPSGKVSEIQEKQFTTLGQNITALEVDGNFDDCQRLVKSAFMDKELNKHMKLTSANSINVARFLPQSFYYFNAFARLDEDNKAENLVVCVPSGNFGNITAGLFAHRMGLPVKRFIAANNRNDVFLEYLRIIFPIPRRSEKQIYYLLFLYFHRKHGSVVSRLVLIKLAAAVKDVADNFLCGNVVLGHVSQVAVDIYPFPAEIKGMPDPGMHNAIAYGHEHGVFIHPETALIYVFIAYDP